jgi:GMP synthase (glutamine-hydrolysing)
MILIIDCGSQTTHLIARRIKALGRPTLITTPTSSLDTLAKHPEITHIVLSGGPRSVYEPDAPHIDVSLYTKGLPMLGICYGMQLIAHDLGGTVSPGSTYELGSADIIAQSSSRLFGTGAHTVWMNHGDFVSVLPPGFLSTAHTSQIPHAVIEDHTRHIYGVQFHPEVTHTPHGVDMLASFLDITDAESIKHAKNQHIELHLL